MKKQNVEIPAVSIYEIHLLYKHYTEIPGTLSRENIISSQREDRCYFHTRKDQRCYGYIINRALRRGAFDSTTFVKVVLTQLRNGERFT